MPSIKVSGIVMHITDEVVKGSADKPFKFKEIHIKTDLDSQYPQLVAVQFAGKNLDKLDSVSTGQEVEVEFNLNGRAGNDGRVWNTLSGWRIAVTGKAAENEAPKNAIDSYESKGAEYTETIPDSDLADSLPF